MKSKNYILWLILLLPNFIFAQYKNYNTESAKTHKGEIFLNNGESYTGTIVYNFVNNSLKILSEKEEHFYGARNVSHFTLEDSTGTRIKYYSLYYDLNGTGNEIPYFFKVLYENENVAILSKKEFEFKKQKQVYSTAINEFFAYLTLIQYLEKVQENVYLANSSGKMYHFLASKKIKASSYELDFYQAIDNNSKELSARKKNVQMKFKIERSNALDLTFGEQNSEVNRYIKEFNLDVKNLNDLAKICDFYSHQK